MADECFGSPVVTSAAGTGRPTVSVIIIFYNAERFLAEAIESVINQTERNWELLLVDDGSRDGGREIACSYARRLAPQVRYLHHPDRGNRGMSATRNLGIRNSRGEWVAFLDADDVWSPDKLAEQLSLLASHPEAGLLYGSPLYWFSWSRDLARYKDCQPGLSVAPESLVPSPRLMLSNYPLGDGPAPCPSDFIVKRTILDRVGGFEETFGGPYQMYEDQVLLAKVYLTTSAFVSGRCWTRYRQHPDAFSTVVRDSGKYRDVRLFFLEYLNRYLSAEKIDNREVWEALERAYWPYRHPRLATVRHFYARVGRRLRQYRHYCLTARTKMTTG